MKDLLREMFFGFIAIAMWIELIGGSGDSVLSQGGRSHGAVSCARGEFTGAGKTAQTGPLVVVVDGIDAHRHPGDAEGDGKNL